MLLNASRLLKYPVLSLHIGGRIAEITELIVDPNNLEIIACRVDGALVGQEFGDILPVNSIREFSQLGIIIDSADDLVESGEILRIKKILDLNFSLLGLKIVTRSNTKVGKVVDFTLDSDDWTVRQVVAERPFLKSFFDPELIISHEHIVEVDDFRIVIDDDKDQKPQPEPVSKPTTNFVNPFRNQDLTPEPTHSTNHDLD